MMSQFNRLNPGANAKPSEEGVVPNGVKRREGEAKHVNPTSRLGAEVHSLSNPQQLVNRPAYTRTMPQSTLCPQNLAI